jgi:hypothetical protein
MSNPASSEELYNAFSQHFKLAEVAPKAGKNAFLTTNYPKLRALSPIWNHLYKDSQNNTMVTCPA